jgi:hypothetical protein
MVSRRLVAVFAIAAFAVALAVVLARGSTSTSSAQSVRGVQHLAALEGGGRDESGGAAAEAYSDRAFPMDDISIEQIQGAIAANNAVKARGAKLGSKWDFLGPETLNVDRLGTQAFTAPTQWSGRVTALAIDPKCKPQECTLYAGAAGGGVWRSKNALAPNPSWKFISDGIPTNAIGSITVDPNDATGKTIYVGTGEANASGDSEAGVGLYRTTDDGAHWSLVPGAAAISNLRAIGGTAIEPGDPSHIAIATRSGVRGLGSNSTSTGTVAAQSPATGIWETHDGGANWALTRAGTAYEVRFDPGNPNVLYAAIGAVGIVRSTNDGAWETIFSRTASGRFTFSPVVKEGKTRMYLADANGAAQSPPPTGAQVYRVDDASQPAATLTASNNAAWTRLSNPTAGTPGNAVYNYCNTPLVGSQCFYDMYIASPADNPDEVVVSGLMHYEELKPYAAPGGMRSNGRSVMMSTDAGLTWKDMTGDPQGESMHPDQHAVVFVPGNPNQFFAGSDGGVIRTNGKFVDGSSMCNGRGLNAAFLADCQAWLSRIPAKLEPVNAGLATLQMNSIGVSPFLADTASTGTQDNGTLSFSGSTTWGLPLTGDGGDSGFDATEPKTRFHTYTGGQMDINYDGDNPASWLWIGDVFITGTAEGQRFYAPVISDPVVSHTIFVGAQRVWRTQDLGGDRAFLEQHCNTAANEFGTSDLLYTGACGSADHWKPMSPSLTASAGTKGGGTLTAVSRGQDAGTMWVASQGGRIFVTQDANAPIGSITFTRIDTAAQPNRVPSSVFVDPTNANHAIVTFSGYEANTPTTLGHVFDVVYDPAAHTATWTNISSDIGDQPLNDAVIDTATGDLYISTDFGVYRRVAGTTGWIPAADGLPMAAVAGLTIADGKNGDRLLYAATHGRGAYLLRLK